MQRRRFTASLTFWVRVIRQYRTETYYMVRKRWQTRFCAGRFRTLRDVRVGQSGCYPNGYG